MCNIAKTTTEDYLKEKITKWGFLGVILTIWGVIIILF